MIFITEPQFKKFFPKASSDLWKVLNDTFQANQINTLNRVASFLAECGVESGGFTVKAENLNYSEQGLLKVFKKYFSPIEAKYYAHDKIKIANKVYANRMGNGPEASGDGWKYAGKGFIQITGKDNYKQVAEKLGKTLDTVDDYMLTDKGALESAIWYWTKTNCNKFADKDDIVGQRKVINGGTNGLEEVKTLYEKLKKELAGNFK
jgi:putative chitinase